MYQVKEANASFQYNIGEIMRFKNIIFDFGNVLSVFNADRLLELCTPAYHEAMKKAIFHDWDALDDGTITYEDYIGQTLRMSDRKDWEAIRMFFDRWYLALEDIEEVQAWVHELKREGYHLYILSNAPVIFEENVHVYPIVKEFDGAVYSGSIQLSKPDKAIYHYLLNKYQLKAEECFFIDDKPRNVEAARQCGIEAMVYHQNLDEIKKAILV